MEHVLITVSASRKRKFIDVNQPRMVNTGLIFLWLLRSLELSLRRLEKMIFKNKIQHI
jgi:hypothetical protein